jgi:hypothetical protein
MEFLMRWVHWLAYLCIAACASSGGVQQQLDERTGATLTWMDTPWVFAHERPEIAVNLRDYANLYAVDVNKSGKHRLFVLVHEWSTVDARGQKRIEALSYDLLVDDRVVHLQPTSQAPQQLGIGKSIDLPSGTFVRDAYCPISLEDLRAVTLGRQVSLRAASDIGITHYETWKEARRELSTFLAALSSSR